MNYFTKKQSYIFMSLSFLCLLIGTVLICFSHDFINFSYYLLSEKVFHRSFDLTKWLPTIESFFIIPSFLAIVATSLFFHKFDTKNKIIILSVFLFSVLFITFYCIATRTVNHVDSDLASEILLAKECVLEKTLWPRTWNYSTEIRLFNTQLVTAPAFLFTKSWNTAKLWTSIFSLIFLFFAVYYVLQQINIKEFWIKYLICILSILPFSEISWYVGAWGTYYIPHAIFNLIYVGTFIKLTTNEDFKYKKFYQILFYVWAFLSGLSSIRYIMIFTFPLALVMIVDKCLQNDENCKINNFSSFWLKTNTIKLSMLGLILSGIGYVCNNILLQPLFQFSQWNTISFCTLGDISLRDILHSLLSFFGYQDNIAVLTPSGILNILAYFLLVCFVLMVISSLKFKMPEAQRFLLLFFISSFLFNTFVYLHTELIERYYYPILIMIFPCFAVILSNHNISDLKRYGFATVLSILIFTSSFATVQHYFTTDGNTALHKVSDYLHKNYKFGYSSFWNANIISYLTNGDVEVGNLYRTKENGKEFFTDEYKYDKWLTPERYYSSDYDDEHIFLLVSQEQYFNNENKIIIKNGTKVYSDEYYIVFDYPSHKEFKNSFNN